MLLRGVSYDGSRRRDHPVGEVTPIVFEGCAGWFHPGQGDHAVLLCGPLGPEADYVQRAFWELAQRFGARAFPTLRFDYRGLRDSAPCPSNVDPVEAWRASVIAAAAWLKDHTGCKTVSMVGIRLGATIAAQAASEIENLGKLVLLAPIAQGKTYFRERAALARLSRSAVSPEISTAENREHLVFSPAAERSLNEIDLCDLKVAPAEDILIVCRPGNPKDIELEQHLRSLGGRVQGANFDDYGLLMVNPEDTVYPGATFDNVVEWIGNSVIPPKGQSAAFDLTTTHSVGPGIEETQVTLRPDAPLYGMLCAPVGVRPSRPAVVFLNTGAIGRAGMSGIWVTLARRLASLGVTSLRFDVGGIGESPLRPGQREPYRHMDEAVLDTTAAMDWMVARGHPSVSLVGFCWGAQLACNVALGDDRVDRLVLVNPRRRVWDLDTVQAPMTANRHGQGRGLGVSLLARWKHLVATRSRDHSLVAIVTRRVWERLTASNKYPPMSPLRVVARLRSLRDRGIETLWIQGQDDPLLKEFEVFFQTQRQALSDLLQMTTIYPSEADHLFKTPAALNELNDAVCHHLVGRTGRDRKSA